MPSGNDSATAFEDARELLKQAIALLEQRSWHERDRKLASRNYFRWELISAIVHDWDGVDETRFSAAASLFGSSDLTVRLARIVDAADIGWVLSYENAVALRHDVAWLAVEVERTLAPILAAPPGWAEYQAMRQRQVGEDA